MFNKKSTETVLKEIYEAYPDAFADGRRLSGLFADFSGGQLRAQKNQLDIFLKCGGNTRILALRDEAPRIQQREYRRLVGEMMDAYGMQQELALEISSTFWKTALGTQAPAMGGQEKNEKPAKKPSEKQPGAQRLKGLLMLFWKMSGFARLMFAVGAYGVIACTFRLVQYMITDGFSTPNWILYLVDGICLLVLAAKVFWMPLSVVETDDMISEVFSRRAFVVVKFFYVNYLKYYLKFVWGQGEPYPYFWFYGIVGLIYPFPMMMEDLMVGRSSIPTLAVIGRCALWWYNIVWFWKAVIKKNGPMWQ